MKYCIYLRKSRADEEAEQRGEGETLARHERLLLELAKKLKLSITQIYREIVSGETIAARPVMQQLLTEVEQGEWSGVLVVEIERLARGNTVDQGIIAQAFKFSGTKIITPTKTYDPDNEWDEEYFEFGLFMSRREYKAINRRLQRGRLASVREGKYVGSQPPYGYVREKLVGDKGYTLTPLAAEADIVRIIFQLYTKGEEQADGSYTRLGVARIVRRLNDMRIPPRNSNHWSPATIRDILINPVYIGKIRWNWRKESKKMADGRVVITRPRSSPEDCTVIKGKHQPLIDEDTFNKAQDFMSQNPPRPVGGNNTIKNPLSGLVVCAKCGKKMLRRPYNNRNQADTLLCADTACDNISSALHFVESRILDALRKWLSDYRLQWEVSDEAEDNASAVALKEKTLQRLAAEYDTLNNQLDSVHDLLEQNIYTTEQFLDRARKLHERIKKNEDNRAALSADIAADKEREFGRKQIIPKVERMLDIYESISSVKAKNDMLKEVLEKVVYLKTKNGRWNNSPEDFEITLYPKIPKYE